MQLWRRATAAGPVWCAMHERWAVMHGNWALRWASVQVLEGAVAKEARGFICKRPAALHCFRHCLWRQEWDPAWPARPVPVSAPLLSHLAKRLDPPQPAHPTCAVRPRCPHGARAARGARAQGGGRACRALIGRAARGAHNASEQLINWRPLLGEGAAGGRGAAGLSAPAAAAWSARLRAAAG